MVRGVFVGMSTIDIIHTVSEFPPPNAKVRAGSQTVMAGGPACNSCVTFAHLGGSATLVTAVGRHPLSGIARDELRRYSIQLVDLSPDFDDLPVISSVWVNDKGERNIASVNATRVTQLAAQVDKELAENAAVVLVDGHYMEACQAWARAGHGHAAEVVLDGGSWKSGTEELLKSVDTAICSADFMPPGCSTQEDVLRYLKDAGVKNAAISNGAGPVPYVSGKEAGVLPVPTVKVKDTTGAGDVLHGAYCYYTAAGQEFVDALAAAIEVATKSCRFVGTRDWMSY